MHIHTRTHKYNTRWHRYTLFLLYIRACVCMCYLRAYTCSFINAHAPVVDYYSYMKQWHATIEKGGRYAWIMKPFPLNYSWKLWHCDSLKEFRLRINENLFWLSDQWKVYVAFQEKMVRHTWIMNCFEWTVNGKKSSVCFWGTRLCVLCYCISAIYFTGPWEGWKSTLNPGRSWPLNVRKPTSSLYAVIQQARNGS